MFIYAIKAREETFLKIEENKKAVYTGIKKSIFDSIESAITDGRFSIDLDFVQTNFIDLALLRIEDELKSLGYSVFVDRSDDETYFTVEWKDEN